MGGCLFLLFLDSVGSWSITKRVETADTCAKKQSPVEWIVKNNALVGIFPIAIAGCLD